MTLNLEVANPVNFHFCTLGMGTINYRGAARRLANEASSTGLFVKSFGHDEKYLRKNVRAFWSRHRSVLKPRVPGFGWWIWKPTYISAILKSIPENDVLMYLDAGSYIGTTSEDKEVLRKYLELAALHHVVGSSSQSFSDEEYCSKGYLDFLSVSEADRKSNQFWAGFLIVKNSNEGRKLVERWRELTCERNHGYLLPVRDCDLEVPGFIHHMYDQALLSPLLKKSNAIDVFVGDRTSDAAIRMSRHRFAFKVGEERKLVVLTFRALSQMSRVNLGIQRRIIRNSLTIRPSSHS